ncbi:hypothetical protein CK489_32400 [Bradyrhizobium sp. UFLA03-84]|nr:hypothetical protein CK489_32400 [Bradyrhizobium sp. UFLA03-84]
MDGATTVVGAITMVGVAVITMAGTEVITTVGAIITAIGGDNRKKRPQQSAASFMSAVALLPILLVIPSSVSIGKASMRG